MTDLCRWPGWGEAAAAPGRSPRAAPQSAGLGGGRMGRCGPEPSIRVTPARPPFPGLSQLPVPPVWVTAVHHCRRRWEEPPGMSRACRYPGLEKKRRWSGVKGQCMYQQGSRCVTWSENERETWCCDGGRMSFWFLCWCCSNKSRKKYKDYVWSRRWRELPDLNTSSNISYTLRVPEDIGSLVSLPSEM